MNRVLQFSAAGFVAVAAASIIYVLGGTLMPSTAALASLPHIELPSLMPGSFTFARNPASLHSWPTEYLFVRDTNGGLAVFEIPTKNGRFTMPDGAWWRPGHVCQRFEPDFARREFRCNDTGASASVRSGFRWSLEGKSLDPHIEDMIRVKGRIQAGYFVVGAAPDA